MYIEKLRIMVIASLLSILLLVPFFNVATVGAVDDASKQAACEGIGISGAGCTEPAAQSSISNLIATGISILSFIVGIAAVLMLIIGGFRYITSGGDSNSISAAKNTILYAIIGLVVAVLAQAIVQFVLRELTTEPVPESSISAPLASLSL